MSGLGSRLFQSLVDRDTGAEDGGNFVKGNSLGDMCNVSGRGDGVLLEGSVDRVAGEFGGQAEGFIGLLAECAGEARVVQPFDTDGFADPGNVIGDELTTGNNDTGTLVTTDER